MSYGHNNTYYQPRSFAAPRITWAVQRLIFANILVFAFQLVIDPIQAVLFAGYAVSQPIPGGILNYWMGFQPDWFLHGMVWKPFTYQFLHSGLMHLFMNMLWLFFFGPDVERTLGTRQFFRFYLTCGVLGVLATLLPYLLAGRSPSVTGSSGAVMGVMVAFAIVDPDRQFYLFPLPFPITARALVLIVIVMNVVLGLGEGNVSVATHFGGMAVGFAYMKLLPQINLWQRERRVRLPLCPTRPAPQRRQIAGGQGGRGRGQYLQLQGQAPALTRRPV